MREFEIELLQSIEAMRTDTLNNVFEGITIIGEETLIILLVSIFYFAFDKRFALKLFFVSLISVCVSVVIKNFVQVPRPFTTGEVTCVRPETATGYSFPSGHTQLIATWSSALAMYSRKIVAGVVVALLIVLVGASRVYLGAHYPSDVVVGALLGLCFGIFGCMLYDRVQDKKKLYVGAIVALAPFALFFLITADPLFEDFFKVYGMAIALPFSLMIEERYVQMDYDVPWWKKVLRIVIAVALTLAVKEGVSMLNLFDVVRLSLAFDMVRYTLVVLVVFGLCPLLLKKLNL